MIRAGEKFLEWVGRIVWLVLDTLNLRRRTLQPAAPLHHNCRCATVYVAPRDQRTLPLQPGSRLDIYDKAGTHMATFAPPEPWKPAPNTQEQRIERAALELNAAIVDAKRYGIRTALTIAQSLPGEGAPFDIVSTYTYRGKAEL